MSLFRLALIAGILIFGFGCLSRFLPGKSRLQIMKKEPHFPVVSGYNLDRQEFEFPRDFSAKYNLVIVVFQRTHQGMVNTWIPFLQEIEASHSSFIYYELPIIQSLPALSRSFINEGMRVGIPDPLARERTVTLYLDKAELKAALDIHNEDEVHLLLVDREGTILWRTTGAYSVTQTNRLVDCLKTEELEEGN